MIKFTLPNFYHYKNVNNVIYHYTHIPNSTLFKFAIQGEEGSLPFFTWNGHTNINFGFTDYYYITELEKMIKLPLYFDCSNQNIQDIDLLDVRENLLLSSNMTATNGIIVSDYNVMKYLKNKYPFYHFIASEYFLFPEGIDREQVINEFERFRVTKIEDIEKFPIGKVEFVLPTSKCYECKEQSFCKKREQLAISTFRNTSVFRSCQKHGPYVKECIDLFNLIRKKYHVTHFCFDTDGLPLDNFGYLIDLYLNFFITPEFQNEVGNELRKAASFS